MVLYAIVPIKIAFTVLFSTAILRSGNFRFAILSAAPARIVVLLNYYPSKQFIPAPFERDGCFSCLFLLDCWLT